MKRFDGRYKECSNCYGLGRVPGSWKRLFAFVPCSVCDGAGRFPRESIFPTWKPTEPELLPGSCSIDVLGCK